MVERLELIEDELVATRATWTALSQLRPVRPGGPNPTTTIVDIWCIAHDKPRARGGGHCWS